MKPLRKLTLSRKSSKQSVRDREQTPPVPGSPASPAPAGSGVPAGTASPIAGLAGKSRPPESSSAGAAGAHSNTRSPDARERDGSLRGKKPPPSAYNNAGAGGEGGDEDTSSPRRRKVSVVSKSKRRISAIFNNSPSKSSHTRDGSVDPDVPPVPPVPSLNGSVHAKSEATVSTPTATTPATPVTPTTALPAMTVTAASLLPVESVSPPTAPGVPSVVVDAPSIPNSSLSKLNGSKGGSHDERALPALPTEAGAAPTAAEISAAVSKLQVGPNGTPGGTDKDGFPFDTLSPNNARTPGTNGGSPLPTSALSTPGRMAKVQSLYTQWADYSDSEDEDMDGFATPSEGLSEVEEEDEEDDTVSAAAHKLEDKKDSLAPNAAAAPLLSPASVAPSVSSRATKVSRSKAGAAKVNHASSFKRGDPLSIDQGQALAPDLDLCRKVLTLFLESKMREAEMTLVEADPENNHLYLQNGHGLIQSLKGLMTFDSGDLNAALDITKGTAHTASVLRRPTESVFSKLGGLVRSGHAVARIKAMTVLERHAELVYAETILIKAILAIVAGGDWLGLIKEAFNMRTAHGIYRTLQQYLDEADKNGFDEDIDMDFRSGVLLGTGTSSLMLSLLPARVLKIAEVFGYAGDRTVALETLMSAGGWTQGDPEPAYSEDNEGIRRPICDMILLTFHLVISVLMPVAGVDVTTARHILNYNMKRYPNGIFFLYFQARLFTNECEPELANESLQKALDLDLEYVQLQHMCLWDYGCNYMQLTNWEGARQCFDILRQESNWSRAVYTYATAVNVMELVSDKEFDEATPEAVVELVVEIPKLTKKIAGKSLPIEKFCARKARKFVTQGNRLFLPAMELAYIFGTLGHSPRRNLIANWLPHINAQLAKLEASTPDTWGNGEEYWDDYALGYFLRGVVKATARYQPTEASANARGLDVMTDDELDSEAEADFKRVVEIAPNVRLDHWILYHNHYELGRLYAKRGDVVNARINFEVVTNTKLPQPNLHAGKNAGKYSLEGALQIKTHAALQDLKENGRNGTPSINGNGKSSIKSGKSGKSGK